MFGVEDCLKLLGKMFELVVLLRREIKRIDKFVVEVTAADRNERTPGIQSLSDLIFFDALDDDGMFVVLRLRIFGRGFHAQVFDLNWNSFASFDREFRQYSLIDRVRGLVDVYLWDVGRTEPVGAVAAARGVLLEIDDFVQWPSRSGAYRLDTA